MGLGNAVIVMKNHGVFAAHIPNVCRQRGAAGVSKVPAWSNYGLFSNYPFTTHLLHVAIGIRYLPVPGEELHGHVSCVADGDGVGEGELIVFGPRMRWQKRRLRSYTDERGVKGFDLGHRVKLWAELVSLLRFRSRLISVDNCTLVIRGDGRVRKHCLLNHLRIKLRVRILRVIGNL